MDEIKITKEIIKEHGLTEEEYELIKKILKREPNIVELGLFSVMWSEHCSYKSSKIHLRKLPTEAPWVIQGPGENAGVIEVDEQFAAVFKMESHNHPSYIEPFQGAATGVGGILRDIFTMGARPALSMDPLFFGNPDNPHNAYILNGVVSGIAWYGNCIGVPTIGGQTFFAPCYDHNPLVNVMNLGIAKRNKIFKAKAAGVGNPVIYVGSKTGRDGIHGATMASDEFKEDAEQKKPNVQVGDPFTEKLLLEACLEAMEKDIIVGIQDMGAAGLTCSTSEMAAKAGTGIEIDLDLVPQREENMNAYEIMLSESQERMLIVAERGKEQELINIFKKWGIDAVVIGKVTDDGLLKVKHKGKIVAEVPVKYLAEETPVYRRPAKKPAYIEELKEIPYIPEPENLKEVFLSLLASYNIASKRFIWRQYDHMVQINTVIYPGSDAAVIRVKGTKKGIAVSTDVNPRYCYLNPREGAKQAVTEAARNVACSGAKPRAITNCLNFGNPEKPEVMWQFIETIEGMAEACKALETPVTGGNVSFYNETLGKGIWPSPSIGMVGILEDVTKRVTQFFKRSDHLIVLIGKNKGEIGGSEYLHRTHNMVKGTPPKVDLKYEKRLINALVELAEKKLIASAHDISLGGLAIALAESCMNPEGFVGAEVELNDNIRADLLLFGEDQGRVIISLSEKNFEEFRKIMENYQLPFEIIGKTNATKTLSIKGRNFNIELPEMEILEAYNILNRTFDPMMF